MANVDSELERLLEEFDLASRRMLTRIPLIDEALEELPHATSVRFSNYLGFGRELSVDEEVRAALAKCAEKERAELVEAVEKARERVVERRTALALL